MRSTRPIGCAAARTGARCSGPPRRPIARATARDPRAATMCSIWATGTRRATRPRISPRPSRSGWRRARAGSAAMRRGRRCASCNFVQQFAGELGAHCVRRCAARDRIEPLDVNQRTLAQHYRSKLARARSASRAAGRPAAQPRVHQRRATRRADRGGLAVARAQGAAARLDDPRPAVSIATPRTRSCAPRSIAASGCRLYVRGAAARCAARARAACCARLVRLYMRSHGTAPARMKPLRTLVVVHYQPAAPGQPRGLHREGNRRMAHRVRCDLDAARRRATRCRPWGCSTR